MSGSPSSKRNRAEHRVVACFPLQGPAFEVWVPASTAVAPGRHLLSALQDAVAAHLGVPRGGLVRVFHRASDGSAGAELTQDCLPEGLSAPLQVVVTTAPAAATASGTELPPSHPFVMFASALGQTDLNGSMLEVPSSLPSSFYDGPERIFVRSAFDGVLGAVDIPTARAVVVEGTPGVGKSTLRVYLLWCWLKRNVLQLARFTSLDFDLFDVSRTESVLIRRGPDSSLNFFLHPCRAQLADSTDTLGIYELCAADTGTQRPAVGFAVCCASGGALEAFGSSFTKQRRVHRCVMPVWDWTEIAQLEPVARDVLLLPDERHHLPPLKWSECVLERMARRFDLYGGVPRLVVEMDDAASKVYVEDAIAAMRSGTALQATHRLLKLEARAVGRATVVDFISRHMWHLVVMADKHHAIHTAKRWASLMSPSKRNRPVEGHIFEAVVYAGLTTQGAPAARLKYLDNGLEKTIPGSMAMRFCFNSVLSNPAALSFEAGTLYVPIALNQPTWDSCFVDGQTLVFLHLTVSATHAKGRWKDLARLCIAFRTHSHLAHLRVLLLYVVPSDSHLSAPPPFSSEDQPQAYTLEVQLVKTDVVVTV